MRNKALRIHPEIKGVGVHGSYHNNHVTPPTWFWPSPCKNLTVLFAITPDNPNDEIKITDVCDCRGCTRYTGSAFLVITAFPLSEFRYTIASLTLNQPSRKEEVYKIKL